MPKIYTKAGDRGSTKIYAKGASIELDKDHLIIQVLGKLDRLSVDLGFVYTTLPRYNQPYIEHLQKILLDIGSCISSFGTIYSLSYDYETETIKLEYNIDQMTDQLPELRNFILPQDSIAVHYARVTCRELEGPLISLYKDIQDKQVNENFIELLILIMKFINRLSDYLFTLARYNSNVETAYKQGNTWNNKSRGRNSPRSKENLAVKALGTSIWISAIASLAFGVYMVTSH